VSHCNPPAGEGADAPRIIVHKETHVEFDFVDARVGQRQAQFAHLVVMGGTRSSRLCMRAQSGWPGIYERVAGGGGEGDSEQIKHEWMAL
jgi:hypothetical protein